MTIKCRSSLSIFFAASCARSFWTTVYLLFYYSEMTFILRFFSLHFRYIAVTQPIKYAKHKNSLRIFVTILLVWAISIAIGSPIVLGLNNTPNRVPDLCAFFNTNFIIFSSLVSFYIPCIIMVFLYWNIFKVSKYRIQNKTEFDFDASVHLFASGRTILFSMAKFSMTLKSQFNEQILCWKFKMHCK